MKLKLNNDQKSNHHIDKNQLNQIQLKLFSILIFLRLRLASVIKSEFKLIFGLTTTSTNR